MTWRERVWNETEDEFYADLGEPAPDADTVVTYPDRAQTYGFLRDNLEYANHIELALADWRLL